MIAPTDRTYVNGRSQQIGPTSMTDPTDRMSTDA